MGVLIWALLSIVSVVGIFAGAIATDLVADEVRERVPLLATGLIRRAAKMLPVRRRAEHEEEWLAHLNECPAAISKLLHAIGCVISALKLRGFYRRTPVEITIDGERFFVDAYEGRKFVVFLSWVAYHGQPADDLDKLKWPGYLNLHVSNVALMEMSRSGLRKQVERELNRSMWNPILIAEREERRISIAVDWLWE